jgi:hypothetical protein
VNAEPLTLLKLLDLAGEGVAEDLLRALVERDCVDFSVDAENVAELSSRLPASVLKAAIDCRTRLAGAPQPAPKASPFTLAQVRIVAVAPIVINGVPDSGVSTYLAKKVGEHKRKWKVLGATELALGVESGGLVDAVAPLSKQLAAARDLGAQALLRGDGSSGMDFMGANSLSLQLQLVEVNTGKVLWSGSGQSTGGGFTPKHAANMAVRSATRKLP